MKRTTIFLLLVAVIISLIKPNNAYSQIILPPVSSPVIEKISVVVPELRRVGGSSPKAFEFIKVLRNDLRNAAFFNVLAENIPVSQEGTVDLQSLFERDIDVAIAGQYTISGNNLVIAIRAFDVSREEVIVGKTYTASPGRVREAAHRFANEVMKNLTGVDGFFTSKLIVVRGGRKRDLYILDYDGFNPVRITNHNSLLMSPHCSRDGSKVVFNSDKVWDQDLYVTYLVPRLREVRLANPLIIDQSPEWSPDGTKIAYSSKGDIYIANENGKGIRRITRHRAIDVSPTWSPDGKKIAFVSDRTGRPQIYVMNVDGSGVRQLTFSGYNTDPSWSPNPSVNRIAFVRVEKGGSNIYTINPDGSEEKRLTYGTRRNETPSWTPDGHFITFSSTRNVSKDIYIMYWNGENQRPLTKGGGKSFPTWCKR